MAELQGFFMFFKDQPEKCAANVGPYLQSRREAHQNLAQRPPDATGGKASPEDGGEATSRVE